MLFKRRGVGVELFVVHLVFLFLGPISSMLKHFQFQCRKNVKFSKT